MNKIYCFLNAGEYGGGMAYAIGDDGILLGTHGCTHESWVKHDLVNSDTCPEKHENYKKHFPNGYEIEFIANAEIDSHKGLHRAFKLNFLLNAHKRG